MISNATGPRSNIESSPSRGRLRWFRAAESGALLRFCLRACVLPFAVAGWLGSQPAAAESLDTYLIPGVDIRDAEFTEGAWCRYHVVDEADGLADTTDVYVAVTGSVVRDTMTYWWLEMESRPFGGDESTTDLTAVLVSDDIRGLSLGDSLYHYVREVVVRSGLRPPEPGDPRDLKRLTLSSPSRDPRWSRHPGDRIATPAGALDATRSELDVTETRRRKTGRVTVKQERRDHYTVWSSREVPLFRLVRCVIERTRESSTEPRVRGIPNAGPRTSTVTSQLVAWGQGAGSKLQRR